ncbi:SigE family RNA polymerase sigma factor [Kutzneria buriramensis]|uniref:RNA polymerase sigma-70 factor (Sigma-E family) n=1 Tax=Kutzneria buriramensis TaxID=1045776 RepID=A0A3E0HGR0_9PSEU|nr:SigE family RNA polymerase sigma factor [Kutzneria buriramensis]REH44924.1 RNA polymerase sigma-70 factor (sigma-E family) [Kutzneria buriramensis]
MADRDIAFAQFVTAKADSLQRTAYLLCGDWHRAEDLTQVTFTKLYRSWPRLTDRDALDGYARKVLVRAFLSERRLGWFRREHVTAEHAESPERGWSPPEDRMVLLAALAKVPPGQRAVLVLRYWEDMSIEDTARALECSEGTVKSQAARGLQALRALLGEAPLSRRRGA